MYSFLFTGLFIGALVLGLLFFASPILAVVIAVVLGGAALAAAGALRSRERRSGEDHTASTETRGAQGTDQAPRKPRSAGRPASGEGSG